MDKKLKIAMILLVIVVIAIILIFAINIVLNEEENTVVENVAVVEETNTEENVMVVNVEKKEEEEEDEEIKDAATLTQEIYDLNMEIGTLYIPKTGLNTPIYCRETVEKMESMPCFLYTTGGLNKTGVTLILGHNRMNGKLFSDNDNLEEGDVFYFEDYKGVELEYTIYSIFTTTESDTSYLQENVDAPVIVLSCCTDANDEHRLIVMGKADI